MKTIDAALLVDGSTLCDIRNLSEAQNIEHEQDGAADYSEVSTKEWLEKFRILLAETCDRLDAQLNVDVQSPISETEIEAIVHTHNFVFAYGQPADQTRFIINAASSSVTSSIVLAQRSDRPVYISGPMRNKIQIANIPFARFFIQPVNPNFINEVQVRQTCFNAMRFSIGDIDYSDLADI